MSKLFESLEIFGIEEKIEDAILASMLLGEPALLMGPPGTAKTEIIACLGACLREASKKNYPSDPKKWFNYQIYDASKLNFEDLIGYPSIKGMQADPPHIAYIPTQSTIWDKHMVGFDELNRCVKERQSNLFEVIRSRKVCGQPTGTKFIYSTMNPFGDTGTQEMSDALVDRHLFFLRFCRFAEIHDDHRVSVIKRVGQVDSVGIRFWGTKDYHLDIKGDYDKDGNVLVNEEMAEIGNLFVQVLTEAAKVYAGLESEQINKTATMVSKVVDNLSKEFSKETATIRAEMDISGRRAGMMQRGILALRSIQMAKSKLLKTKLPEMISCIISAMHLSLPAGVAAKVDQNALTKGLECIHNTVMTMWPAIEKEDDSVSAEIVYELFYTQDPFRKLQILLDYPISKMAEKKAWSDLAGHDDVTKKLVYSLSRNTNLVPPHVVINKNEVTMSQSNAIVEIKLKGPMAGYSGQIESLKEEILKMGDLSEILTFAYRLALEYYIRDVNTHALAYDRMKAIEGFTRTLIASLVTKSKSQPESADSKDATKEVKTEEPKK